MTWPGRDERRSGVIMGVSALAWSPGAWRPLRPGGADPPLALYESGGFSARQLQRWIRVTAENGSSPRDRPSWEAELRCLDLDGP
jgi:hypothetical protein